MNNLFDGNSAAEENFQSSEWCPFIGLALDPQTNFQYPSLGNYCHKIQTPQPINPEYQQIKCLTPEYTQCVVFSSESWKGPLPKEIHRTLRTRKRSRWKSIVAVSILCGLIVVGFILYFQGVLPLPYSGSNRIPTEAKPTQIQEQTDTSLIQTTRLATIISVTPTSTLSSILLPTLPEYTPVQTRAPTHSKTPPQKPTNTIAISLPRGLAPPSGSALARRI